MSNELKRIKIKNRIELLTSRGEMMNIRIINKLKRKLRKLES